MKAKIHTWQWSTGHWGWTVSGTLLDGEQAYRVDAVCGVMEKTRGEALSAARRVAQQLGLTIEE